MQLEKQTATASSWLLLNDKTRVSTQDYRCSEAMWFFLTSKEINLNQPNLSANDTGQSYIGDGLAIYGSPKKPHQYILIHSTVVLLIW